MNEDKDGLFMRVEEYINREPKCQYCEETWPTWADGRGHMCDGVREHRRRVDERRAIHGIAPKQWRN